MRPHGRKPKQERDPMRRDGKSVVPRGAWIAALLILAAAPAARAADGSRRDGSLGVNFLGGWQNLEPSRVGVGDAVAGREGTTILGGDVLARLGNLGLGVAADKTVSGSVQPWSGSLVAGVLVDLPLSLRIDALGEMGRRGAEFNDLFSKGGFTFVGLRPGASVRLASSRMRVGLTGLVRWTTSDGKTGSPDYGLLGRVGLEL